MTEPRSARLADIAAQADVSEATVSRVLNDRPGVSEATRQAVLTAIESDLFRNTNDVPILYNPAVGSPSLEPLMRIIVNHWSIITGRDVKAGKVATS